MHNSPREKLMKELKEYAAAFYRGQKRDEALPSTVELSTEVRGDVWEPIMKQKIQFQSFRIIRQRQQAGRQFFLQKFLIMNFFLEYLGC